MIETIVMVMKIEWTNKQDQRIASFPFLTMLLQIGIYVRLASAN